MKNLILVILTVFNSIVTYAKTIEVNTIPELQSAINAAKSGDIISLADNKYPDAGLIKMDNNGITVKSASLGGVIFSGKSFFVITGNKNILSGFQFKEIDVSSGKQKKLEKNGGEEGEGRVVAISGNYNVVTQCNFYNCISKNYVHFEEGSQYNELTYCNLEAKPATMNAGPGIQITTSSKVVSHTKIIHCTFMNFGGEGGDFGNEPIKSICSRGMTTFDPPSAYVVASTRCWICFRKIRLVVPEVLENRRYLGSLSVGMRSGSVNTELFASTTTFRVNFE